MNADNTKKLWDTFPRLYKDKDAPITQSLIPFGFECGDGWFQLIWDLSEKLEKLIEGFGEIEYPPKAVQVKEKYGTLRFYMTSTNGIMDKFIDEAENRSAHTCEVCGRRGKIRGSRWSYCACIYHTCYEDLKWYQKPVKYIVKLALGE
jgi:hypothetical protein